MTESSDIWKSLPQEWQDFWNKLTNSNPTPEKQTPDKLNQNRAVNLRFGGLILLTVSMGLTSDVSQPLLLIIINLFAISMIIMSISIKSSSVFKYLILTAECLRCPILLYSCQRVSNYLFWTLHSFQILLIMFPDKTSVCLVQLGLNLVLVAAIYPIKLYSTVLNPLINSTTSDAQENSLMFFSCLISSFMLLFYVHRNVQLDKVWRETTNLKDREIAELRMITDNLQKDKTQLLEMLEMDRKYISQHLSMASTYCQTALEEAGSKIRDIIQKADAHAQMIHLALLNRKLISMDEHDPMQKGCSTTLMVPFLERIWQVICGLVVDNVINGSMKISRGIPKKMSINADRVQAVILNTLLFVRQATSSARFKVSLEWSQVHENVVRNPRTLPERSNILTSFGSGSSLADENVQASALIFPKDYVFLDSKKSVIKFNDLVDVLEGMQGSGLLKIKISIRCSEEMSQFMDCYFGQRLSEFQPRTYHSFEDNPSQWEQLAQGTLKSILQVTKHSNNFMAKQKRRGFFTIEFYENAELITDLFQTDPQTEEANYWIGSHHYMMKEKPNDYSTGMMQRSFARIYKIGNYPRKENKRVLVVDNNAWSKQFFDWFFIKNEYATINIKDWRNLLDTVKVEYDTLDLIVINDETSDVNVVKAAADVHSFLRIVNHPSIVTVLISELNLLELPNLTIDYKDLKILKRPINLKELREMISGRY